METDGFERHILLLIEAYLSLDNGARSELRKLEHYNKVPLHAPLAFYKVKNSYFSKIKKYQEENPNGKSWKFGEVVISSLLLFWRDRQSNEKTLKTDKDKKLGSLFVGDGKDCPVKVGRFKRIMRAEGLEDGFNALRQILSLFRHEIINWGEVASLISAFNQNENGDPNPLNKSKKKLSDAYFTHYQF